MMQSFKYGLTATVGYMVLLTVLLALTAWIEGNGMSYIYYDLISPFNAVLSAICGIIVFFTGYCFPRIFSRMVADYKSEYPDVPEKYVVEICRDKLMKKCSYNLAIGCFFIGLFNKYGQKAPDNCLLSYFSQSHIPTINENIGICKLYVISVQHGNCIKVIDPAILK